MAPGARTHKRSSTPRSSTPRSSTPGSSMPRSSMSEEHKAALAKGREEGRAVRRYLEALEEHKPRRGRKRTPESIRKRLAVVEQQIHDVDPLTRLHLLQEREDLSSELSRSDASDEVAAAEKAFRKGGEGLRSQKGNRLQRVARCRGLGSGATEGGNHEGKVLSSQAGRDTVALAVSSSAVEQDVPVRRGGERLSSRARGEA